MIVGSEPSTHSIHASTQPVRYALLVGTLPCVIALALTAFTALEKASVDPTVSAGYEGASSVPVPYVPIAAFAVFHSVGQLLGSERASRVGALIGACLVALAALFLFFAGPIRLSEAAYGIVLVLLQISLIGIILLPVVVLAIPLAGALFGLAIYLPLSRAQRSDDGHGLARHGAVPLVAAGVAAAIFDVAAFGLPTWSAMTASGHYSFPRQGVGEAWFGSAPVIALNCLLLSLAGVWTFGRREKRIAAAWLALCAVPVAILVAVGGWALSVAEVPLARSGLRQAPLLASYSRFIRDGRPRISEPISLGDVEVAIDRALLKYQLADNSARQVTTVVFQPQPDLIALGVRGPVVLNKGKAPPAQQEAERRGATCAANALRPVIVCQFSKTIEPAIEIDAAHPTRSLERKECRLIFADISGLTINARMEIVCESSATWHLRADAIEQFIKGTLRRK